MSDSIHPADNPQHAVEAKIAENESKANNPVPVTAETHAASDDDKTHDGAVNIPSTNPMASNVSPTPALPDHDPLPDDLKAADREVAKHDDAMARQDAAQGHETHPDDGMPTAEGARPSGSVAPPPGDNAAAADEQARADQESMDRAEQDKQARAEAGTTASPNGDVAGTAFGPLIDQAKFELRNLGHDFTIGLLDALFAGIQRLEQKTLGG